MTVLFPGCLLKSKKMCYLSATNNVFAPEVTAVQKGAVCIVIASFEEDKRSWYLLMCEGNLGWDFFDDEFFISSYYEKIT